MKTEVSLDKSTSNPLIKIQITLMPCEVLGLEEHLDRLLDRIGSVDACNILYGGEIVLTKLGLKTERLMADDGNEHYFIPKLHRLLEEQKLQMRVLHMGKPIGKQRKE